MVDWIRWFRDNWVHNRRFAIWTVAILAFLVRLIPSFVLATYAFKARAREDHWAFGYEWGRIAKWLLDINTFSLDGVAPTSNWDPLYVFIIAPFFLIFGTYTTSSGSAIIPTQQPTGSRVGKHLPKLLKANTLVNVNFFRWPSHGQFIIQKRLWNSRWNVSSIFGIESATEEREREICGIPGYL